MDYSFSESDYINELKNLNNGISIVNIISKGMSINSATEIAGLGTELHKEKGANYIIFK